MEVPVCLLLAFLAVGHALGQDIRDHCDRATLNERHQGMRIVSHRTYPAIYDNSHRCEFSIQAPEGKRIFIVFDQFHLEQDRNCKFDYLSVFNGRTATAGSLIGNQCGNLLPPPMQSQGSALHMLFRADASVQRTGFAFRFYFCESSCCDVLYLSNTSPVSTISSPNYPSQYNSNSLCTYHVVSRNQADRIKLEFSHFHLELSGRCICDAVTIRDGLDTDSCTSNKICGRNTPAAFVSSLNTLTVTFSTDRVNQFTGFSANATRVGVSVFPLVDSCQLMRGCCAHRCTSVRSRAICSCHRGRELMPDTQACECPRYCELPTWTRMEIFRAGTRVVAGCFFPAGDSHGSDNGRVIDVNPRRVMVEWTDRQRVWYKMCEDERSEISLFDLGEGIPSLSESQIGSGMMATSCSDRNGGCDHVCRTRAGAPQCECMAGYVLASDSTTCDMNSCADNNGDCSDMCTSHSNGTKTCSCGTGYRLRENGWDCADVDECADPNHPCEQRCVNSDGSFRCECGLDGFRLSENGHNCSDVDECLNSDVHHCDQRCVNTRGSYFCGCNAGYVLSTNGKTCIDINECSFGLGMRCEGPCLNLPGSYRCTCVRGLRLGADGFSCVDIPECTERADMILNRANCIACMELTPGYACGECRRGYEPTPNRTWCNEIDECSVSNGGCQQNCTNTDGGFQCSCFAGYAAVNMSPTIVACVNIDECASHNGNCSYRCTDSPGSFTCSCQTGAALQSNQLTCEDINECLESNGGCQQECNNTYLSHECYCRNGYVVDPADATACLDVNECEVNEGGCRGTGSACSNIDGGYLCECESGFALMEDVVTCEEVNECLINNGGCQQVCTDSIGRGLCSCHDGFEPLLLGSPQCTDVDECSLSSPCNMTCSNTQGSFTCSCDSGYELMDDGETCRDVDECSTGGNFCTQECINNDGSYSCTCLPGFQLDLDGRTCLDVDECSTGSSCCSNGCENALGTYRCQCPDGFYLDGDGCNCKDIKECSVDNGGCEQLCVEESGSYRCECRTGFAKDRFNSTQCHDINECKPDLNTLIVRAAVPEATPCSQRCENTDGGYQCHCRDTYRLKPDLHSCKRCPTCETFTALEDTVAELVIEIRELRNEIEQLKRGREGYATPGEQSPTAASPVMSNPPRQFSQELLPDFIG